MGSLDSNTFAEFILKQIYFMPMFEENHKEVVDLNLWTIHTELNSYENLIFATM